MKKIVLIVFCTISAFTISSCRNSRLREHQEWGKIYNTAGWQKSGIIIKDQSHDIVHYYNLTQDTTRFLPASTFKIVLSLVGLETGLLRDDKFVIQVNSDSKEAPQYMNLREAFATSSEPYFKEVAKRIGRATMLHYLDTLNYGNKKLGENITNSWHDDSLRISADEQLGFVKQLYFNQLPLSDRSQRIVRSLMLRDDQSNKKLFYKTGWGQIGDSAILWAVGFVEYPVKVKEHEKAMNKSDERDYVFFFAQNSLIANPSKKVDSSFAQKRIVLLNQVLDNFVPKGFYKK